MLRFSFGALGIGLSGNENVYFASVVKFNDFSGALVIVKENELFSDVANTVIGDVREIWENSHDINAFLTKVNQYSKHRIMPFSISYNIDDQLAVNKSITVESIAVEAKNRVVKFFKEADILIKDANTAKEKKEKKDKKEKKVEDKKEE